jgi:octaprenyl-diphosphate synthase
MGVGKKSTVDREKFFSAHAADLRMVEEHLQRTFTSDVALLTLIGRHILRGGGKRLRPLFLIKAARLAGYVGEDHYALGAVIETIHTASLLHDDVVDGAAIRRGRPSAHSLWGNPVVVLAGDYLYSYALKLAVRFGSLDVMEALSTAVSMMAKGELLQMEKAGDVTATEDDYRAIVSGKTGILFSTACRIGGLLAKADAARVEALATYGMNVGIAFQVADDILDFEADESEFGKRLGTDLDEGKVTLPLIYLLRAASATEREEIGRIIAAEDVGAEGLATILSLMQGYGVREAVLGRARTLVDEAREALRAFPPSSERDDLDLMAEFALMREK